MEPPSEQERPSTGGQASDSSSPGLPSPPGQPRLQAERRRQARRYARQLAALSRLEADGVSLQRLLWVRWLVETGRLTEDLPGGVMGRTPGG
jgi:hypothetical protein